MKMRLIKVLINNLGVWIVSMVIVISIIMFSSILSTVINDECMIESINFDKCYEEQGMFYINRYYNMNREKIAYVTCGPIMNCHDQCNFNVYYNTSYMCGYSKNNIYKLTYDKINILFLIVFAFIPTASVVMLIIIIIYKYKELQSEEFSHLKVDNIQSYTDL
jgi:hypothetical protein